MSPLNKGVELQHSMELSMPIIGWQIEPKIGELEPKKLDFSTNLPDMNAKYLIKCKPVFCRG